MAWSNRLPHDRQVLALGLLAGLPAVLLALWFVWNSTSTPALRWTLTIAVTGSWIGFTLAARTRVVHPLRTLGGLLAALREGDFSIQARGARQGDALGDLACELNALIGMLREQRLGALETTALLRTVMEEINLAVFAFDDRHTLRLVTRAGEKLPAHPPERLLGRPGPELDIGRAHR